MSAIPTLEELVGQDEGFRSKPYKDTLGNWTIGYGRNLDDVGISEAEGSFLRESDCARARKEAETFYWFPSLDEVRRLVVLSMMFQLGLPRFLEFNRMIIALKSGDYSTAAKELEDSLWARQTPERAQKLARWMDAGACD